MANRTVKDAHTVHGTNPQYLIEKIIRSRIYECKYWKEHCFALSGELLVDKAVDLKYVGGVYGGNVKPTPFLCLILKMLQIQPDKDIVVEFIKQQDYKYVRALGAVYLRLIGDSTECYKYLEPLYNDYRKLKFQDKNGNFSLQYMDEFIDDILHEERIVDIILPRLQKRSVLEETNVLEARQSLLDEDLEDMHLSADEDDDMDADANALPPMPHMNENSHHHRDRGGRNNRDRDHYHHREDNRDRYRGSRHEISRRERSRSRNRDREAKPPRRNRSRDKDRERQERRRSHSRERRRSRSRDKEHKRRAASPDRKKSKGSSRKDRDSKKNQEIEEANALRTKLGIPLLRP